MRLSRALGMFPRVRVGLSREAPSGARPPSGPRPPPPRSQRTSLGLCTPWGESEAETASPEPHLTPPWGSPPRVHLDGVWDRHPLEMGWGHPWRSCRAVRGGKPGPPGRLTQWGCGGSKRSAAGSLWDLGPQASDTKDLAHPRGPGQLTGCACRGGHGSCLKPSPPQILSCFLVTAGPSASFCQGAQGYPELYDRKGGAGRGRPGP